MTANGVWTTHQKRKKILTTLSKHCYEHRTKEIQTRDKGAKKIGHPKKEYAQGEVSIRSSNMIGKILCFLGWHKDWPVVNNIMTPTEVVYRTYMRCTRPDCKRWGKLLFFKKVL